MHPSPSCGCPLCSKDLDTAWRLQDRDPYTDMKHIIPRLHPFLWHVRRESERAAAQHRAPDRGPRRIEARA